MNDHINRRDLLKSFAAASAVSASLSNAEAQEIPSGQIVLNRELLKAETDRIRGSAQAEEG